VKRTTRREYLALAGVSSSFGIAGCSGLTSSEGDASSSDDEPTGDSSGSETISDEYQFSEGERYTYEGQWSGQDATVIWDVISAETDSVEVQIRSDSETFATVSSTHEAVFGDVVEETGEIMTKLRLPVDASSGRELTVGESWTASVDERLLREGDTVAIEVIETATVDGVSCTMVSVDERAGGSAGSSYEACVTPGYPLVVSYNNTNASGYNLALTESERP